jgi:hypothetical protein
MNRHSRDILAGINARAEAIFIGAGDAVANVYYGVQG